jgi:hypothetical protein
MQFSLRIVITLTLSFMPAIATAQTADKNFWKLAAWNALATATDGYTTISFRSPTNCQVEGGAPELYGKYPEPPRTGAVMGGMFVASTLFSYELKKHYPHAHIWKIPLWVIPMGYNSAIHARGTAHNWRVC